MHAGPSRYELTYNGLLLIYHHLSKRATTCMLGRRGCGGREPWSFESILHPNPKREASFSRQASFVFFLCVYISEKMISSFIRFFLIILSFVPSSSSFLLYSNHLYLPRSILLVGSSLPHPCLSTSPSLISAWPRFFPFFPLPGLPFIYLFSIFSALAVCFLVPYSSLCSLSLYLFPSSSVPSLHVPSSNTLTYVLPLRPPSTPRPPLPQSAPPLCPACPPPLCPVGPPPLCPKGSPPPRAGNERPRRPRASKAHEAVNSRSWMDKRNDN